MQRGQQYPPQNPVSPFADGGYNRHHANPFPSLFGQTNLPSGANPYTPFHNVDIQPSNVCPRNFIIFDQTDNRSQIMFHPTVAPKFFCPGLNNLGQSNIKFNSTEQEKEKSNPNPSSSFLKEDSDDIDALMSLDEEDEEDEEEDGEEVSTARTYGNYGGDSADSGSTKPGKRANSSCSEKSSGSDTKRIKMKNMVKNLRGILPGGEDMNAVDILDEAVKYLKSLKVEVHKLGIGNISIKN